MLQKLIARARRNPPNQERQSLVAQPAALDVSGSKLAPVSVLPSGRSDGATDIWDEMATNWSPVSVLLSGALDGPSGAARYVLTLPDPEPLPAVRTERGPGATVEIWTFEGLTPYGPPSAEDLAVKFLAWTQRHPPLVRNWLRARDIEFHLYPRFCDALQWPMVPYRDFAKVLARITRRRQRERRSHGERETWTEYLVPSPRLTPVRNPLAL